MSVPASDPPGFLRTAWIVLRKDLRIEGRTKETLAASLLFALVELTVFAFAFGIDTIKRMGAAQVVPGILWLTVAFSAIVGFTRSFRLERARDAFAAVGMAPVDRGAIFAGKATANLAVLLAIEAILLPLTAVFFDADLVTPAGPVIFVVALHTAGLAALGTLFGGLVSRLGRGEALLSTLLLPAATPLFLSAVQCTAAALDGRLASARSWLLLCVGLDVLYVLVALLVFDALMED